jgi:sialate O-acetylesterase
MRLIDLIPAALFTALALGEGRAEITLPPLLSDHMVLQREMKVPIWGAAEPGEAVKVSFAGQSKTAAADKEGKWRVDLDPLKASAEPRELTVAGRNTITLKDVLVGEVWLGSGQSNMDMALMEYPGVKAAADTLADNPQIRFCGWKESDKIQGTKLTGWFVFNKDTAQHCSAMLFFFGTHLQKELKVPIGLIPRALGGTPSIPWCPEDAFNAESKHYARPSTQTAPAESARRVTAGSLFRSRIAPCIPYAIRGVVWDQGESGTGVPEIDQSDLMRTLIIAWRREWQRTDADFPFLLVQKPSGGGWTWSPERRGKDGKAPTLPRLPDDPANTNDR